MENNVEQELARKFQVFEQQIRMLQEQLQAVEQTTMDLRTLDLGLDDLKGSKDKEILAQVGRGIFVKAKVISDDLIVDIGGKNFVSKDIDNTKNVLQEQVQKLGTIQEDLEKELDKINQEITGAFLEHQQAQGEAHDHKQVHGEDEESEGKDFGVKLKKDCDCEDDCKGDECEDCNCGHKH
jgi:prefoldin alpha subunit